MEYTAEMVVALPLADPAPAEFLAWIVNGYDVPGDRPVTTMLPQVPAMVLPSTTTEH